MGSPVSVQQMSTQEAGRQPVRRTIDLPEGFGAWVFMLFTTDFEILTPEGIAIGSTGDIVVNSPDFPQWHRGIEAHFHNYWIHFRGAEVASRLERYGIKLNHPVTIHSPFKCLPILYNMEKEFRFREQFWEEAVDAQFETLFREIGRQRNWQRRSRLTEGERQYVSRFHDLRLLLWRDFRKPWTITAMLEHIPLSESRFLHLYRRIFNVSPVDDLINARLERSKALLSGTLLSVGEIADQCGFGSVYYFSRVFKKREGVSPRLYRGAVSRSGLSG